MRILVVADIHSNWQALQAIREPFDACLCVGDLVDYGTDPIPCIDWVREHATAAIRGNHDHAVAQRVPARPGNGFRGLAAATRPLHWDVLDCDRMRYLARLPVETTLALGGLRFHLVHATPRDPMDEYLGADVAGWRTRLRGIEADFVCVGHTHAPFQLDLGGMQVLNPGSVGQPRDGDPRASFAIVENGKVSFHRVEYNIEAAIRQMRETGIDVEAVEFAARVLRTGGQVSNE